MKKLLIAASVSFAVSACSMNNGKALEQWDNYGSERLSTSQLTDTQALAVFYRTADFQGPALNVYIDGDYQASILDKSYTPVAVCASQQLISTSYKTNQKFGNRTQGTSHILPVKEIAYFRATKDASGAPSFERVDAEVAKAELSQLTGKVTNTLPRVKGDRVCGKAAGKETVLSHVTLSASALWGLDKDSYQDMLPKGKKEIAEFAEFAKGSDKISRIEVRGYTDPEASAGYNLALSQRRAETVRQALLQAGVSQEIYAKGYGKSNLVVSNCADLHKNRTARAECNLPNRRVEITTYAK